MGAYHYGGSTSVCEDAMHLLKITKASHYFIVSDIVPNIRYITTKFCWRFNLNDWKKDGNRWTCILIKAFYIDDKNNGEIRIHANALNDYLQFLKDNNIQDNQILIENKEFDIPLPYEFEIRPEYSPRANQIEDIKFLDNPDGLNNLLLQAATGTGKSFMSLTAVQKRKTRFAIVIRPGYIDKWLDDIQKHTFIKRDEIFVIQGSGALEEAITLASAKEFNAGVVIISNRTLQAWYRDYETIIGYRGYGINPDDLFEHLGIGIRLIDEVHQDFHLMFKIDLYTHVKEAISMSAEIDGDIPFENNMARIAYPLFNRSKRHPYPKYVHVTLLTYNFKKPQYIKYKQGANYNHIKMEQSIMKYVPVYKNYIKMILDTADHHHSKDYQVKDKLIIFVSSIELATKLTAEAKKYWPSRKINRYVEDDPLTNLMTGDVTITTLLSGGTGHDIPNLTTVILTPAVKATRSNIQGFGRLRDLPNRKMKFVYMTCKDIKKHVDYSQVKMELLDGRMASFAQVQYPYLL